MSELISSTIVLFLIMDPIGNLPLFMGMLKHLDPRRRRFIIIREMLMALPLMILFLFAGERVLSFLRLRTEAVSITGGLILFFISMKMLFPTQEVKNDRFSQEEEPFLVPLAIPLVAGPSVLAALMMLSHQYPGQYTYLILVLLIAWVLSVCILMLSNICLRLLGNKGINAMERLMGLLLAMIATQMFIEGNYSYFRAYFALG